MTNDVAADLERLICDLADIGSSTDVDARRKARRLYADMRAKYPEDARLAAEPGAAHCATCQCAELAKAGFGEPEAKPAPSMHLMTITTDQEKYTARCSCGAWKTEVTNFGRTEDWPSDQMLADFRVWHKRHLEHLNR